MNKNKETGFILAVILLVTTAVGVMSYEITKRLEEALGNYVWLVMGIVAGVVVLLLMLAKQIIKDEHVENKFLIWPLITLITIKLAFIILMVVFAMFKNVGIWGLIIFIFGIIIIGLLAYKLIFWMAKD